MEQLVARRAHNPKVVSSSLAPATRRKSRHLATFSVLISLTDHCMSNLCRRYATIPIPFEMYYFYILFSLKDRKLYKGVTSDLAKRFIRHNAGGNKSTAHRKPFVLVHVEIFESKKHALIRENYLKSLDGSHVLDSLLKDFRIYSS